MIAQRWPTGTHHLASIAITPLLAAALILLPSAGQAHRHEYRKGNIEIEHPYATTTAPGQPHGAVFIKQLKNSGNSPDRLVGGRSTVSTSVEVHQMVMEQSLMKMREIPGIDIPAKAKVSLDRGSKEGYHLMLMNLNRPLSEGERFTMTLNFQQAGSVEIEVVVEKLKSGHQGHRH